MRIPNLVQFTTQLRSAFAGIRTPNTTAFAKSLSTFTNTHFNPAIASAAFNNNIRPYHRTAIKSLPSIPFLSSLFSSSSSSSAQDNSMAESFPLQKSDDEWRTVLTREQFRILREKGTERPGTGEYEKHSAKGVYNCAGCDAPLYKDAHKFDSHCGWPAFFDAIPGAIKRNVDRSYGMERTEIVCANCGGHLGHVFKGEGYKNPIDERHCVNSVSMSFSPEKGDGSKA